MMWFFFFVLSVRCWFCLLTHCARQQLTIFLVFFFFLCSLHHQINIYSSFASDCPLARLMCYGRKLLHTVICLRFVEFVASIVFQLFWHSCRVQLKINDVLIDLKEATRERCHLATKCWRFHLRWLVTFCQSVNIFVAINIKCLIFLSVSDKISNANNRLCASHKMSENRLWSHEKDHLISWHGNDCFSDINANSYHCNN